MMDVDAMKINAALCEALFEEFGGDANALREATTANASDAHSDCLELGGEVSGLKLAHRGGGKKWRRAWLDRGVSPDAAQRVVDEARGIARRRGEPFQAEKNPPPLFVVARQVELFEARLHHVALGVSALAGPAMREAGDNWRGALALEFGSAHVENLLDAMALGLALATETSKRGAWKAGLFG